MKKIILSGFLFITVLAINAQTGKPVVKPAPKPVPLLKTTNDTLSYVMGEVVAFALLQQNPGLSEARPTNATFFMRAYNDITSKKPTLINDLTANAFLNNYMTKIMEVKAKPEIEKGQKFLAQNKLKPGVVTTPSGLQYEIIKQGTGIKPTAVDTFVAHYRGTLLDGTEFDASYNRGEPLTYPVGKVIAGWTEVLLLMPIGSKYKTWIPYGLGYGVMGSGKIPGGALLTFELELLDVKKGQ